MLFLIVPRGALHEQFVKGKIKVEDKDIYHYNTRLNTQIALSSHQQLMQPLIKTRLTENENNIKNSLATLITNPINLDIL